MKTKDFEDLIVWQRSRRLVKAVYQLTAQFPSSEKYGLSSQMQRAAVSIPSNIAEGYMRASKKEYAHFLAIAAGSAGELTTLSILAYDLDFIPQAKYNAIKNGLLEIRSMLYVMRRKLIAAQPFLLQAFRFTPRDKRYPLNAIRF